MNEQQGCGNVGLSLPSLRVDAFTVGIASEIQKIRRTGLTFAPEGGTWRMRQVINKLITDDDLYAAVEGAYSQGWQRVKLYFLIGVPTEMDEDTLGIAELAREVVKIGRKYTKKASCTASVGGFVPKAHTPFQWFGQNGVAELQRKVGLLRDELRRSGAQLRWHDPAATFAEGIASRGDRRIGRVIERVWRAGGTFQEWSERFQLDRWLDAMAAEGLDPDWYVTRHRTDDEILPWDHIAAGLHRDFLWDDWQAALREHGLPDCRWTPCYDCGVCTDYALEHVVASAVPPAGREPGHRPGARLRPASVTTSVPPSELAPMSGPMRGDRGSRCGSASPSAARCGSSRTATSPGRSSARSASRSSPRVHRGLLAPAQGELRAGAVGRPRERRRVPRRRAHGARRHRRARRAAHRRRCPRGSPSPAPALIERAPALQESITEVQYRVATVDGRGRPVPGRARRRGVGRAGAATSSRVTRTRKGKESVDDSVPRSAPSRSGTTATRRCSSSRCRPNPAVRVRVRCSTPSTSLVGVGLTEHRVLRTAQWIERGGARLEPLDADAFAPALEASAS